MDIKEILNKAKGLASDSNTKLDYHAVAAALGGATFYQDKGRLEEYPQHMQEPMAYFATMNAILTMSGLKSFSANDCNGDFHKEAIREFYDKGYHNYNRNDPFKFNVTAGNDNSGDITGGQINAQIDLPLTDVLLSYYNEKFICDDVLTPNPAERQSGKIGRIENHHLQNIDKDKAKVEGAGNVAQVNSVGYRYQPFEVEQYALMDVLTQNDRMNVLSPFEPRREITMALGMLLKLIKEVHLASILFDQANFDTSGNIALTNPFSDSANSNFNGTLTMVQNAILAASGSSANICLMDAQLLNVLIRHPHIVGTYFKDMSKDTLASFDQVRAALKVEKLLIGHAYSAASSDFNSALSRVWNPDNAFFGMIPSQKSLRTKTYGFHHFYKNKMDYIISRQSHGNPQNEDIFAYMNWSFDSGNDLDKRCGLLLRNTI